MDLFKHRHISTRNTVAYVDYVRQHLGDSALVKLFANILDQPGLISSRYHYQGQPLDLGFFESPHNWFSNDINLSLFANLRALGIELEVLGRYLIDQSERLRLIPIIGLLHLMGPEETVKRVNEFNRLFNNTKHATLSEFGPSGGRVTLQYHPGMAHSVEVTQFNLGIYQQVLTRVGYRGVKGRVISDQLDRPGGSTELEFEFQRESLVHRVRWLFGLVITRLFARTYCESGHYLSQLHQSIVSDYRQQLHLKDKALADKDRYQHKLMRERREREQMLQQEIDTTTVALAHANRCLNHELKQKEDLFARLSHELRTPLMLLQNPLRDVLTETQNTERNRLLNLAVEQSERLSQLIDQMLDYEQASSREQVDRWHPAAGLIASVQEGYQAWAEDSDIQLTVHCGADIALQVDETGFTRLLQNLLSNAIKFNRPQGQVMVRLSRLEQGAELAITDTGQGIPAEELPHVFDRFYRGAGHQGLPGVGIGLAIVKKIVARYDAAITVASEPNGATRFCVIFPPARVGEVAPCCPVTVSSRGAPVDGAPQFERGGIPYRLAALRGGAQPRPRPLVLIVDGNVDYRDYLVNVLEPHYECRQASTGLDAWGVCQSQLPDLLLAEITLPDMAGTALLAQIRNDPLTATLPVLILTAKPIHTVAEEVGRFGIDALLQKPVSQQALLNHLRIIVERQRQSLPDLRMLARQKAVGKLGLNKKDRDWLRRLQAVLDNNYQVPGFGVAQFADAMHCAERTLQRQMARLLGMPPKTYLLQFRALQAVALMETAKISLEPAAKQCGLASAETLQRLMEQMTS